MLQILTFSQKEKKIIKTIHNVSIFFFWPCDKY